MALPAESSLVATECGAKLSDYVVRVGTPKMTTKFDPRSAGLEKVMGENP
jgi:hypothetical protein